MSDQAKVSSIDALEAFRADLIRFVEKARVALDDAEGEVRRTRNWLDGDRTTYWTRQMKLRARQLEQAEADLYNARIIRSDESHAALKMAVAKAKRRIEEAEEKLRVLKHWRMHFDNRVTPLVRRLSPAFFLVSKQLPDGIHALGESIKALQAYAEKGPAQKPAAPAATDGATEEGGAA